MSPHTMQASARKCPKHHNCNVRVVASAVRFVATVATESDPLVTYVSKVCQGGGPTQCASDHSQQSPCTSGFKKICKQDDKGASKS